MAAQDTLYNESLRPNECWICTQNCVSCAETCHNCGAVILPTRSAQDGGGILEWNVISPLVELQCPILRVQMMISFGRDNGGAVRVGNGDNKVLIVKNHAGVRKVCWSFLVNEKERMVATRMWADMGEEEWAEVHRILEGVEGSEKLVEGMTNM